MSSIFLSYSHKDKPFASRLIKALRRLGHIVWDDESEINVGDSLIERVREGIDNADYVAVILSHNSIQSEWVKRELDIASNKELECKKIVVLPILIDEVELPGILKGKLYANFRDEDDFEDSLAILSRRLGPASAAPKMHATEEDKLRTQLADAYRLLRFYRGEAMKRATTIYKTRSASLVRAVEEENRQRPEWKFINEAYAFEAMNMSITVGYALWAIRKASIRGAIPLEAVLTLEKKWPEFLTLMTALGDYYGFEQREECQDDGEEDG